MGFNSCKLTFGFVVGLGAWPQGAHAQVIRECTAGEAIQSLDASGRAIGCIAVPPPVDLGAVNAAISAETSARMAGDEELRIAMSEGGLSGQYAVVGSAQCLRSTGGFSASIEFLPLISIFQVGNNPPGSNVQPQSFTYTGVRTINPTGMHGRSTVYAIAYPASVASGFVPGTQPLVFTGGFLTGQGNVVETEQDFAYEISADRTLTITPLGAHGRIVRGAGVGSSTDTAGAAPLAGKISKDWRTIVLTNADMAVEQTTTGSGQPVQRVCTRIETMYKLAD